MHRFRRVRQVRCESAPSLTHSVTRVTMSVTVSGLRFLSPQHETRPWLTTVHYPARARAQAALNMSSSSFLGTGHHTSVTTTPTLYYQLQEYLPGRYLACMNTSMKDQRSFPRTNSDMLPISLIIKFPLSTSTLSVVRDAVICRHY